LEARNMTVVVLAEHRKETRYRRERRDTPRPAEKHFK